MVVDKAVDMVYNKVADMVDGQVGVEEEVEDGQVEVLLQLQLLPHQLVVILEDNNLGISQVMDIMVVKVVIQVVEEDKLQKLLKLLYQLLVLEVVKVVDTMEMVMLVINKEVVVMAKVLEVDLQLHLHKVVQVDLQIQDKDNMVEVIPQVMKALMLYKIQDMVVVVITNNQV